MDFNMWKTAVVEYNIHYTVNKKALQSELFINCVLKSDSFIANQATLPMDKRHILKL